MWSWKVNFSRPSFSKVRPLFTVLQLWIEEFIFSPRQTCCFRWGAENACLWSQSCCLQKGSSGSKNHTSMSAYVSLQISSLSFFPTYFHSFFQSVSPSLNLSTKLWIFLVVCVIMDIQNLSFLNFISYNSMAFLYKAHAIALTLTVTLSLTQTDVIKRFFICFQNPACLPTTILWFCQASSPSHQRLEEENCTVTDVLIS